MKKQSYSDLLKDPRWQKKKTEILKRDKFTCKLCGDTKTTLHVHHKEYIKGNDPWDYPNNLLVTLCAHCHEEIEKIKKDYPECSFAMFRVHKSNNWSTGKRIMFTSLRGNVCSMGIYDENDQFIVGFNLDYKIQNIINVLKHTIKNG